MSAPDPTIPTPLKDALQRLDRAHPTPNLDALDQAVLNAADAHFALRQRRHSRIRTLRIAAGIAASIALIAAITWQLAPRNTNTQPLAADTFDPTRQITILDAFHLARLLKADQPDRPALSQTWDVNHDGKVDQRDVETLAQSAVKLSFASPAPGKSTGGGGGGA